ncbi:MAG: Flp pilus assembly complex ATPase component TadA, partial [Pseudomonadales bacterium]|nr:Flp pilus assembly complex ATPase component TadA [Pseudomonadales bacterium]
MSVNESVLINAAIQLEVIDTESVSEFRQLARRERVKLLDVIMREKRLPLTAFYQSLAVQRGMTFLTLAELKVDEEVLKKIPSNLLSRRLLLPIKKQDKILLAVADPDDMVSVDSVKRILGGSVEAALAEPTALKSALQQALGDVNSGSEEGIPVKLLDQIMQDAYIRRASDIHFEPERNGLKVRMRVDGHLQDYPRYFSRSEADGLLNRIKVLSGLDISESRMPQDGGFSYHIDAWEVPETDIRLATIPSRFGERATMRILGQADEQLSLDDLGMPETLLKEFREQLQKPHGILLVTGPTGSGKSTTLYGALRELDKVEHNVLTVEDPIEQVIEGVSQVQVTNKVSFASALRSFLRHDPDIILVGEIRDIETADTALKAVQFLDCKLVGFNFNDCNDFLFSVDFENCNLSYSSFFELKLPKTQ